MMLQVTTRAPCLCFGDLCRPVATGHEPHLHPNVDERDPFCPESGLGRDLRSVRVEVGRIPGREGYVVGRGRAGDIGVGPRAGSQIVALGVDSGVKNGDRDRRAPTLASRCISEAEDSLELDVVL
jgi:hypothetical protein